VLATGETFLPQSLAGFQVPIFLALVSQIAGQALIVTGLGRTSAAVAGLLVLVQPVVAAAVSWRLFGESADRPAGDGRRGHPVCSLAGPTRPETARGGRLTSKTVTQTPYDAEKSNLPEAPMRKTLTALPLIALVLGGCAATPAETETAEVVVAEPIASPVATLEREPAVPRQAGNDYYLNAQAAIDAKIAARGLRPAKNVILFIGDGMSIPTVTATRIYAGRNAVWTANPTS
jgi:hypothetical protein